MFVLSCSVLSDSLRLHGLWPTRLLCLWYYPSIQYPSIPGILEWVAISSSRGSSQPRDQTHVSCVFCIFRCILYQLHHTYIQYLGFYESTTGRQRMPRSIYLSMRSRGNIYMYKYEVYTLHIYGDIYRYRYRYRYR